MKKIFIAMAAILTVSSFAADYSDFTQSECTQVCELYAYDFQETFGFCGQIEECDVLSWNTQSQTCEFVETKLVKYPMQCRDIPPM